MTVANAYDLLLTIALGVLGILLFMGLIRSILGPRIADRIVAVNMVGTMTITIISVLALKMKEGYLADISLIYAMLSFLAVVLLTKVYMGAYLERKEKERQKQNEMKAKEDAENA
ncbi:MAG: sodium:proton antiporter [Clostridia bacterium]|nr:sodium:proton antiporter [Clostridia bacterium]